MLTTTNRVEEAIKLLDEEYEEECRSVGYPQDYIPNEPLYWAIHELKSNLGYYD